MLCSSIGLQLPRLRRLSLHAAQTWVPAGLAWQQPGRITQLTALAIDFSCVGNKPPFALMDLAALSSLRSLEHLEVVTGPRRWPLPPAWQGALSFLGDLTGLTHLQLPLWVPAGLAGIGRCQKLRCLRLGSDGVSDSYSRLGELCELLPVIGQLTALTELCLELESVVGLSIAENLCSSASCCNALKQLQQMRVIQTSWWDVPILDVFVTLPHLHTVGGCWLRARPGTQLPTVPQVTSVMAAGDVLFGAFPNLLTLQLSEARAISSKGFAKLSSCTKLRRLDVFPEIDQPGPGQLQHMPTLSGSLSERVSAIHALAKAPCLEYAVFKASADEEVAALACALKGTPALSELSLSAGRSGQVTCMGLVQLAALRQLCKLSLLLFGTPLSQHGAQLLLCALSHVQEVLLVVREAEHGTVIEAALEACRAQGWMDLSAMRSVTAPVLPVTAWIQQEGLQLPPSPRQQGGPHVPQLELVCVSVPAVHRHHVIRRVSLAGSAGEAPRAAPAAATFAACMRCVAAACLQAGHAC